jgi:hypothetical protein
LTNQADSIVLAQQNYHQRGVTIMAQGVLFLSMKLKKTPQGKRLTS